MVGTIAQLVEQRTENPCVAGSIPAGTTKSGMPDFFIASSSWLDINSTYPITSLN